MFLRQVAWYLMVAIVSAIGAWLWFAPVFWELSPESTTFTQGIKSVFFISDDQEFFLGDTTDLQGTIWIFQHFSEMLNGTSNSVLPDIYAPIDGEIVEINNNLSDDASLVNQDPENDGWIFKMKIPNSDQFNSLMTLDEYLSSLKN